MLDNAGIPHVGDAQRLDGAQTCLVNLVELAHTVLADAAVLFTMLVAVGEPTWH